MDWLISSSTTLSWIHTVIHCFYSAADGLTGSKRFTMKGMVSAFYTNGTKADSLIKYLDFNSSVFTTRNCNISHFPVVSLLFCSF